MTLSDEIRRLAQEFQESYDDRMAVVAGIKAETAHELADLCATHEAMAAEQRQWLAEERDQLASDTAAFMEETHAANRQMAAELRAHQDEQESARLAQAAEHAQERADYVASLKSDTAAMLSDSHTAHQAMAEEQRQRLADDRAQLASEVSEMREGLQAEFSEARRVWSDFAKLVEQRRAMIPAAPPRPRPVEEVEGPPRAARMKKRRVTGKGRRR